MLVYFKEADFAPGPFVVSPIRREAVDPTTALHFGNLKILSGLGSLRVDPWSFLLPLSPLVWAAILIALLGVLAILQLLPSCQPDSMQGRSICAANSAFSCVRVILQQGEGSPSG